MNTTPAPSDQHQINGRVDYKIRDDLQFFGRVTDQQAHSIAPAALPTNWSTLYNTFVISMASFTWLVSPTTVVDFKSAYLRDGILQVSNNPPPGAAAIEQQYPLQGMPLKTASYAQENAFTVPGYDFPSQGGNPFIQNMWQQLGSVSMVCGKRSLKMGFKFNHMNNYTDQFTIGNWQFTSVPTNNPQSPANTGSALASYLLGLPTQGGRSVGYTAAYMHQTTQAYYIQDDFKFSPKLTLNLGLRWEYNQWPYEKYGHLSTFDVSSLQYVWTGTNPITGQGPNIRKNVIDPVYHNFAPRVGFAYQLTPKTTIRGGFGMFYAADYLRAALLARAPNFEISRQVEISLPEKALEKSFWIATRIVSDMRRLAFQHFGKDGWLAVSGGKKQREHFDTRDFRYSPKCAAYLYGDDPSFALEMGKRIFLDETDENDGHIIWVWKREQMAIHLAQVAKHFSDYIRYLEQDEFVKENWNRLLKMTQWGLATYDRNGDGLIENGDEVPDHLWCLLVGEPYNFPRVPNCAEDVVVVASMEVSELLRVMASYSAQGGLPAREWLQSRANQAHVAIESSAYDPDAGYYYLLYRTPEGKWYHSLQGINESSRELDVTPYYAALIGGNFARALQVAEYARKVLLDYQVFPMPLQYPSYFWVSERYRDPYGFVNGGCWEEAYYKCVWLWSHCRLLPPLYEAIKRRSEAYVRDADCREWFTQSGEGRGHPQYGISAAAHICSIIEGLFGITPAKFGFSEIEIHPNFPLQWSGEPVAIRVTLPGNGFLRYVYNLDEARKTTTLTIETDKRRTGRFRVLVPGPVESVLWNDEAVKCEIALQPGSGSFVFLEKPFQKDRLQINFASCGSRDLPKPVCSSV